MKYTTKEDTLYYKSMRLTSSNLNVEVTEAHDYSYTNRNNELKGKLSPATIKIFHSPSKYDGDRFSVTLKDRQELNDYIGMLRDFEAKFGHLLDVVLTKDPIASPEEKE